jgi:hypothetical protein
MRLAMSFLSSAESGPLTATKAVSLVWALFSEANNRALSGGRYERSDWGCIV